MAVKLIFSCVFVSLWLITVFRLYTAEAERDKRSTGDTSGNATEKK